FVKSQNSLQKDFIVTKNFALHYRCRATGLLHVFVQREFYFFAAGWAARSDALRRFATTAVSLLPPLSRHLPRQEEASSNESWCLPLQSGRCASSQLPRRRRGSHGWGALPETAAALR